MFIFFIFVGAYFLMNLFIGVIFLNFTENQIAARKQGKHRGLMLTENQQKWIQMQRMIVLIRPDLKAGPPQQSFRKFFYRIVMWGGDNTGLYFDIGIMVIIVGNIITMALGFEDSSPEYDSNIKIVNYFFTGVFIFEALAKLIGLGVKKYWMNPWNRFDAFVVAASFMDILMDALGSGFLSFLRVGPQLARVIRVLRVSRLLKLIRSFEGLQKIIETLIFSLPSLFNVLALLFLVFFIYSILGVFLFSEVIEGDVIDNYVNFGNFGNAMLTLFRCATGEDWYIIMFDTIHPKNCKNGTSSCGTCKPLFLFTSNIKNKI